MPLYEYVCRACTREFEELGRADARPPCPACGGTEVERVMSVVAIGRTGGDAAPPVTACGTCGDPRGPGACTR